MQIHDETASARDRSDSASPGRLESAFGEGRGFLKGFLDAARARLRGAVIENSEQMPAAVRGRHALPALERMRLAREGDLQYGRKFVLGIHDRQQALGHLLGAPGACFRALDLANPLADFVACGVAELLEPSAEVSIFFEVAFQLRRD